MQIDLPPTTIRELIDRMAQIQPQTSFLISPESGRVLTFQGLQEQSILLACQLRHAGLEPGDKIAFLLDNGLFTAGLFLGCMYGGFVSVPLNVRAGVSQLSYTLEHSDAKVVFVGEPYHDLIKDVLAGVDRPIRIITANSDDVTGAAPEVRVPTTPPTVPTPEDPALLMYTSGSTGQPKAAVHSHGTILAGATNSIRSHQLSAADRSLLVLPLYHINAECVTLIPTLLSGGSVVVPHRFSVSQFWDWLDEYRCTWSALVPTIISQLLDWQDPRADQRGPAFARIRFLRSSSAPLSPSLHREFLDKFKLLLIQAMGSTECGNIFSNPLPPGQNKIGSPGLPWGFEARIVNREGIDVPPGEPGEIFLRGPAIMHGYYKDPQGTAMVLDPDGWLHTGDLAYRDPDGYFFVVGRSKELIIKAGVNIAPKQIDEVLESHPAVLEAAAVGVPDRYVGEDLVAFVVLRSGMTCSDKELLCLCEDRLGQFKTPTRIHFAKDLPKGPSGKVQRMRLLEDTTLLKVPTASQEAAAASESIEQIIAQTWAESLSQPQVDVHTNFFALGGHSLLAIQCLSQLREKLPIDLSLSDFFENATVSQQAQLIRKRLCAGSPSSQLEAGWEQQVLRQLGPSRADLPIPLRDRSRPCPLSPAQRRLWFLKELLAGIPVYNETEAVILRGELNVNAIEQAFNQIIERHEILRSTIVLSDEEPVVEVHESWPLRLNQIDLAMLPHEQRQLEVDRLLIDEPRLPFRLEAEPGIRVTLLRLGPREHVLMLMMHHLICDWASIGVVWRELSAAYRAIARGQHPTLPHLPIQHGDYAAWQQNRAADTSLADDLAYWEQTLRGAPELLELPTDRARPGINTYSGARERFRLDPKLVRTLRDCARREKTSLFTVFSGALATLLFRYTGQEDISLGIPLADRDRPELQSVIGFLLHTHVLRAELRGDLSFRELLKRLQKGVLELYAHRAVPFDQVVSRVQHQHNLSYSPLFQVLFNWRDREQQLSYIGLDGLEVDSVLAETRTAKFDLTFQLTDDDADIWLEIEYSTDLFDADRIQRMARHYQVLLEAVTAVPDWSLAELSLLTEAERRQALVDWNQTNVDYARHRCVHELFEEQAERVPHAVAVTFNGAQLTYGELDRRANQLARHLQSLGVGRGTRVAICLDRSLEMVVGLLGVIKAGGAYVPLDPEYPRDRLALMLEDAAVPVLLVARTRLQSIPQHQATVVCLDTDWPIIAGQEYAKLASPACAEDPAYVIYTSGSTGKAKGIEIPHRALVNFLESMRQAPGCNSSDTLLAVTTLSFDIAGLELWLPLTSGARVVLASHETAQDGVELARLLAASHATIMQATPSTWQLLLFSDWKGKPDLKVLCGGEPWSEDLARQLLERCASLWNMYGPTETTIWSAVSRLEPDQPVLIGGAIANTQLYVLDAGMQPAPIGVPGELWIGGDGLARGYLNRPELTRERFVPNPFVQDHGARIYQTGDLVRRRADGKIQFLGRMDHQVKIRGFRIELGEIEEVLRQYPGVQASVVVAHQDTFGDDRLAAYIVSANGALSASELREYLRSKLPEYMIPAAFVRMDKLPLTPNGKVDRKALPVPTEQAREARDGADTPRTPTEQTLAGIWRELLGLKHVGIRDNFFDLGGHSLLTIRLRSRIENTFGIPMSVAELIQQPTLEGIANILDRKSSAEGQATVIVRNQQPVSNAPTFKEQEEVRWNSITAGDLSSDLGLDASSISSDAGAPTPTGNEEDDSINLYQFFAVSDHLAAKSARRFRKFFRSLTIPVPRIIAPLIRWIYLSLRTTYSFLVQVFICEPVFKSFCEQYGRNVHTGQFIHWIQGKGAIVLGDNVRIDGKCSFAFATRFSDRPTLRIGSNSGVGHGCHFTVAKSITIGSHCRIAGGTMMFDSSGHPNDPQMRAAGAPPVVSSVLPIVIHDHVWIGRNSVVVPGVTIGEGAIVAVNSVVMDDVAPYTIVAGNPASQIAQIRKTPPAC